MCAALEGANWPPPVLFSSRERCALERFLIRLAPELVSNVSVAQFFYPFGKSSSDSSYIQILQETDLDKRPRNTYS